MHKVSSVSRRRFLTLTGLTVAGSALAACVAPTVPAAGDAAMEPEPLRITHWWGEAFDNALSTFVEQHPQYDVSNKPAPWDGYHTKIPTTVAAGTAADVIS